MTFGTRLEFCGLTVRASSVALVSFTTASQSRWSVSSAWLIEESDVVFGVLLVAGRDCWNFDGSTPCFSASNWACWDCSRVIVSACAYAHHIHAKTRIRERDEYVINNKSSQLSQLHYLLALLQAHHCSSHRIWAVTGHSGNSTICCWRKHELYSSCSKGWMGQTATMLAMW